MIYNGSSYNENWKISKLAELGTFARGVSKHRPRNDPKLFENGKYPLVQTGDVKEATLYLSKHEQEYGDFGLKQSKLWNTGTLCITIAANIAETAILAYPMCFPDSIVGFSAYPEKSSEEFMYYIFEYIKKSIQNAATGSIQDNINLEYLMSLDFKIPEKKYQDMIVLILSSIDRKILINNAINDNLEQQILSIYHYLFTQFDFPDEVGNPYCSSGGKMLQNDILKRNIPITWKVKTLGELCSFQNGINYDKGIIGDKDYRIINVRNISSSSILLDENELDIISLPHKKGDKYCVTDDSIIIARSGIPGATRILFKPTTNTIFCGFIICCTPTDKELQYYLTFYLKLLEGSSATQTGGSILQNVSQDTLSSLPVPIPPKMLLDEFNQTVLQTFELIHTNMNETFQLINLRDWLLPMLMNGQATIND